MTTFIKYDIPALEQINTPTGRFYETPNGNKYPSVTTVLATIPNPALQEWRLAVGEKVANEISSKATYRGSKVHTWCELYLNKIGFGISPKDHEAGQMFHALVPYLNQFDEIHAMETSLYSDTLKTAGSVDCITRIDGVMYVIDFKTAGHPKRKDEIHSYFMQCAAYAQMFYERTGVVCARMKILMTVQEPLMVICFDERVIDWLPSFVKLRKEML